jgi:hypothetical protein
MGNSYWESTVTTSRNESMWIPFKAFRRKQSGKGLLLGYWMVDNQQFDILFLRPGE